MHKCVVWNFGCVLYLNGEGQVLFKWKQDYLEDEDNSLSNWVASDDTPCFWNQGFITMLDFSPLPFCHLVGDILLRPHSFKVCHSYNLEYRKHKFEWNFCEDIVNCSKLLYLNLSWICIAGKFPDNLPKFQHLQVLD